MEASKKNIVTIAIILIAIAGIVFLSGAFPNEKYLIHSYKGPLDTISLGTDLPETPTNVTLYKVTQHEGDIAHFDSPNVEKLRQSVISEADAPVAALAILENYGGLPADAVSVGATTEYAEKINRTTHQVIKKYPVLTNIAYIRMLNGMPVVGGGGYITMDLGENGELLYLNKVWHTVVPSGTIKIISVGHAFEKLKQGEVLNPLKGLTDVTINKIKLGYYEKGRDQIQEYLDPVWIFEGSKGSGDNVTLYVYARQFANFTSTPPSGTVPLTVSFTDTSDASPMKWDWDFGDGTSSTEQSPTHTYTTKGIYNVSLRAWNDLGSDTIVKTNCVKAGMLNPPIPNFTATPRSGRVPLTVVFNDTSSGGKPTLWYWTFGDGKDAAGSNAVHTYTTPGNYTVLLEVANEDGDVFETRPDYIQVLPVPTPIADFSADVTSGKAPLVVKFTDRSTNEPTSWAWTFGDGYVSTEQNPVHQYDISGVYAVNLTASNAGGNTTKSMTNYITVVKPSDPIMLIDQLIVYIQNQNNLPQILQRLMVGELNDVKYSLQHNHPDDAVMGMKVFKLTVSVFKGWPLTSAQAATMQNSADAIIKEINLPVNQAAIDQTKSLSADVKALKLSSSVETPLLLELEGTVFNLEIAKDQAAITHLNLFITSVKAQDGKKIPHDKVVQLVTKAQGIITTIKS